VSGVRFQDGSRFITTDTRHLKPILREGFTRPDNVSLKDQFYSILRNLNLLRVQDFAVILTRIDEHNIKFGYIKGDIEK
jgi:hypothetical protein